MRISSYHYFPLAWPFLLALVLVVAIVIILVELRVLSYAYEKMGIDRRYVFIILLVSLLGSAVNIPVAELPPKQVTTTEIVTAYGVQYVVPTVHETPRTVLAINVGGAIIPTVLSIYLLVRNRLYVKGAIGVAAVALIVHLIARPIPGAGIATPALLPPIAAALVALLLARQSAPPLAYIAGCLGTLIGADLLNLGRVHELGAPIVSIGGAGTFDGVFLTGIIAVLLA